MSLSPGLIDTGMGRLELAQNPIKVQLAELTPIPSPRQGLDAALPGTVGHRRRGGVPLLGRAGFSRAVTSGSTAG